MNSCSYWAAGHITAFFKIADAANDLLHKGSCGAGFNIKRGVRTKIASSRNNFHQIYFNDSKQISENAGITTYVLSELQNLIHERIPPLELRHTFEVPIGSGYGSSAAAALSTAFAVNSFLELGISDLKLWQIAHKAEIINKTGLGDVLGLYANSKFELRLKEGAPGIGKVKQLNFNVGNYDLYSYSQGVLSKKNILTDKFKRTSITEKGSKSIETFQLDQTFENFCKISLDFARTIDLLPQDLWKIIDTMDLSVKCSQIMLGESLFFFVPKNQDSSVFRNFTPIKEELTNSTLVRII